MAQTYTTQWFSITNGDITTHNPQSLAPTSKDIRVLTAEVQWEGVEETSTSTEYATNTNTATAQATEETVTEIESANVGTTILIDPGKDELDTNTIPEEPSGYSFRDHEIFTGINTTTTPVDQESTVDIEWNLNIEGDGIIESYSGTETLEGPNYVTSLQTITTDYSGTASDGSAYLSTLQITNKGAETYEFNFQTRTNGKDSTTTVNSDSVTVEYPAVPSGFSFNRHYYREEKNGSLVDSGYIYSNSVGESLSVTSNDTSVTRSLELQTRGETTITNTENTESPRVTRDVSADPNIGTLADGTRSNWYSLSGLEANNEEIYHDIDGSREARFRFRFDYAVQYPDAVKELRVYDGDVDAVRRVALADPADSQLNYSAVRISLNNVTYAVDVVDPADSDAIASHRIYHPVHGTLCLRAFATA